MVHTFTALGQYLVADVNSGAVHVLDKMSYDLLSQVEGEDKLGESCPREVLERLPQYGPAELEETWQELRSLQDQGLLFCCSPATTIWTRRPPWSCPVRRW